MNQFQNPLVVVEPRSFVGMPKLKSSPKGYLMCGTTKVVSTDLFLNV